MLAKAGVPALCAFTAVPWRGTTSSGKSLPDTFDVGARTGATIAAKAKVDDTKSTPRTSSMPIFPATSQTTARLATHGHQIDLDLAPGKQVDVRRGQELPSRVARRRSRVALSPA